MSKPTRILTAIAVTVALGVMFAYQDIQKNEPTYQAHPAVVILTDFFGASLSGLICYFGTGWLCRRKERKLKQAEDDKYYAEVARELQGPPIPGLWTKSFAEVNGDDAKARALYIKYRVAQLAEASRQELEKDRLAKQKQEWPKRARKIIIIFAVAILVPVFLAIVFQITADNDGFGRIGSLKILAVEGDADAAYTLGLQYYCGDTNDGVAIDYGEAFKWFLESAGKNHANAQWFLGGCYAEGNGVTKNEVEAVKWYRKSAEQGNRDALYDLGFCYQYGEGVQKNEVEAYKWYSIAVAHGAGRASENLTNIESHITPEQIVTAKQLAAAFVPRK